MLQNRPCYVYFHIDPSTKEIVYVGKGTGPRAFACGFSTNQSRFGAYGNRSQEHQEWIEKLLHEGKTPEQWVQIFERNLTNKAARKLEIDLIRSYKPIFNKPMGLKIRKMTPETYQIALDMRKQGVGYEQIGIKLGIGTMTVYRALNGRLVNGF